jgi:hypothetical protein
VALVWDPIPGGSRKIERKFSRKLSSQTDSACLSVDSVWQKLRDVPRIIQPAMMLSQKGMTDDLKRLRHPDLSDAASLRKAGLEVGVGK